METSIISINDIKNGLKIIKPNYHMNYGKRRIANMKKNGKTFCTLGDLTDSIYTGGIFKRVFINNVEKGIPYISAQHMMNTSPIDNSKLISKKFTPRQNDMTLRTGQILMSCAGTVGNVRLISSDLDGIIGSQDIIRIIADEKKAPVGFIYAYLSSPTAYNYIQSYIYGSVVPRIEPNTLSTLPVPDLSKDKKLAINDLIMEAIHLRVEAENELKEIIKEIENNMTISKNQKHFKVNIKNVLNGDKYTKESRLEADFYHPSVIELINKLKSQKWSYLGDIAFEIHRSGLRERRFVTNGIPLITGQNLNLLKFSGLKTLSRKFTRNIEKNTTKEGDILVSVQGTIGKIEYSYKNIFQGVFASEQLVKISVKQECIHPGYLFAFLKSKLGNFQILKYKTGSVIEWIIENNIASVVIPIPDDKGYGIGNRIDALTLKRQKAFELENLAIEIIEKDIESWQN